MSAIATLAKNSFEVLQCHRPQVRILFAKDGKLLIVIFGRTMAVLALLLVPAAKQWMSSHPINGAVKDLQVVFENSHGDQLANQPPGSAVAIVGVVDKAFAIDSSINNLSRVEADRWEMD